MRVLHISPGNLYGGVETLLVTLARHRDLCPQMAPLYAVCFEGRFSSELREAGVQVHCLGEVRTRRPWTVWQARRRLKEVLHQHPCDVVVCHSIWSQAIFGPAARWARLPLICWLHAGPQGTHWLERWAKRTRPDAVICNSRFTAGHLSNLYPDVPAEVIHCPVTMSDESSSMDERQTTRKELNVSAETVVIIQVSRIEPLKGHCLHLEALARLADIPKWECWFVGGAQQASEQRYLEEIKQTAVRLGIAEQVRFLGQRSDVKRLLAAADIYCQPNTSPDSFGITFIEALLNQLPVVTTALGGALEIVDSSCGVLVTPDNPAALATSLSQMILDPDLRLRLGKSGPSRARSLSEPSQQMNKVIEFFNRALRRVAAA